MLKVNIETYLTADLDPVLPGAKGKLTAPGKGVMDVECVKFVG